MKASVEIFYLNCLICGGGQERGAAGSVCSPVTVWSFSSVWRSSVTKLQRLFNICFKKIYFLHIKIHVCAVSSHIVCMYNVCCSNSLGCSPYSGCELHMCDTLRLFIESSNWLDQSNPILWRLRMLVWPQPKPQKRVLPHILVLKYWGGFWGNLPTELSFGIFRLSRGLRNNTRDPPPFSFFPFLVSGGTRLFPAGCFSF